MSPNSPPTLPSRAIVARPFADHNREEVQGQFNVITIKAPCEFFEFLAVDNHLLPKANKRLFNRKCSSNTFLERVNKTSKDIRDEHAKGECFVPLYTWLFAFNHPNV